MIEIVMYTCDSKIKIYCPKIKTFAVIYNAIITDNFYVCLW